jgi:hypothetical protein
MSIFTDYEKRVWQVRIDAPSIAAVRSECNVDLGAIDCKWITLEDDPITLISVLWLLCRQNAEAEGIDQLTFSRLLFGDVLGDATRALFEAIAEFQPPKQRTVVQLFVAKHAELQRRTYEAAMRKVNQGTLQDALLAKLESQLDNAINGILKKE